MRILTILLFLISLAQPLKTRAGIVLQYSGGYTSYTNDNDELDYSRMLNAVYLGASLGEKPDS